MKTLASLLLAILLTACGGGGDDQLEDEPRRSIGPPDCVAKPEACI